MINIRSIRKLTNNDGLTLKAGKTVTYKTGYQVADYGYEVTTAEACIELVRQLDGNCGIWFADGIYYVDHSFRVSTKTEAVKLGKQYNQISILQWKTMELIYC